MNKHEEIETIIDDMYPETHKDYISSYISDFKATEKELKVSNELLRLYRLHYRNGIEYDHNGKLIHQITNLEKSKVGVEND